MGGAFAAARADVEGTLWNPASIASVEDWALFFHGSDDFGTSTTAFGGVTRWRELRIGASILSVDLGTIDGRDADNQPTGLIEVDNIVAILTLAYPISTVFEVGGSYKLVRVGSTCPGCGSAEPDATGYAFDAAVIARPPGSDRLRLGLVLSNLGPGMAFTSGGPTDPLPSRVRIGAEFDPLPVDLRGPLDLVARLDVRQVLTEFDDLDVFGGVEAGYGGIVFLRAGFGAGGEGRTGPSLGLGIRFRGFAFDLGRSFDDFAGFDTDSPFQVSVGYQR